MASINPIVLIMNASTDRSADANQIFARRRGVYLLTLACVFACATGRPAQALSQDHGSARDPVTPVLAPSPSAPRAVHLQAPEGFVWPSLMVGDVAPGLVVDQWLKGEPVQWSAAAVRAGETSTTAGERPVIVVEFWALWCGPCLAGFGHLSELQKKYDAQGLRIVAITGPERNNDLEGVKAYLAANPERIGFRFAWDIERKTYGAYMIAAGRNAIPCSFVIDRDGRIAYIGHPSRLDPVLDAIFAGSFDLQAAREAYKQRLLAKAHGQTLIGAYRTALAEKQWETCVELGTRLGELDPEEFGVWAANAFGCVLNGLNDAERAAAMGEAMLAEGQPLARHAEVLDRVASLVADYGDGLAAEKAAKNPDASQTQPSQSQPGQSQPSRPNQRVLDLGMLAAKRSIEIVGRNAATARTLARVHWARGERQQALDTLDALIASEKSDFRVKILKAMRDNWAKQMQD